VSHFVWRAVNPKRPKVESIRNPTLFPLDKLEEAGKLASTVIGDRPFSLPGIPTSALRRSPQRVGKVPSIHGACSHGISCPCIMQLATI